jgi:hypothetical protein
MPAMQSTTRRALPASKPSHAIANSYRAYERSHILCGRLRAGQAAATTTHDGSQTRVPGIGGLPINTIRLSTIRFYQGCQVM